MRKNKIRKKFAELLQEQVPEEEAKILHEQISSDNDLRTEYSEYQAIHSALSTMPDTEAELDSAFTEEVVSAISKQEKPANQLYKSAPMFVKYGIPAMAAACVCLAIFFQFGDQAGPATPSAPVAVPPLPSGPPYPITYNDTRISGSLNAILTYIEGTFGAAVMCLSAILAIILTCFRRYKTALLFLILSILSFLLRSAVSIFFNDTYISP